MEIRNFDIEGVIEIIPDIYNDIRGHFLETYNKDKFLEKGLHFNFVQDNQSFSRKNVLRGLHFQVPPHAQGKLVRVIQGSALDIAVDIRENSPTRGRYIACVLEGSKNNMLYIPPGFAHGFLALTDTILFYKCTYIYVKESERGIRWNDPELQIDWKIQDPLISEKDSNLPDFKTFRSTFTGGKLIF